MRRVLALLTAAVFGSLAIIGVNTQAAKASTAWSYIQNAESPNYCITDEAHNPSAHRQLELDYCSGNIAQGFIATPSSYGSGFYSIVTEDKTYGSYCVTAMGPGNGYAVKLYGCDGLEDQAWYVDCVFQNQENPDQWTFPEIVNDAGYALNDYGGYDSPGDLIAVWNFESPAPYSLLFDGPNGFAPNCSFSKG